MGHIVQSSCGVKILIDSLNEVPTGFANWVKLSETIKSEILIRVSNLLEDNDLGSAIEIYEDLYGIDTPTAWH